MVCISDGIGHIHQASDQIPESIEGTWQKTRILARFGKALLVKVSYGIGQCPSTLATDEPHHIELST